MPTTFTPGDEKQDEKLNPGHQKYVRDFKDVANLEKKGTFKNENDSNDTSSSSQDNGGVDKVRSGESEGNSAGGWKNTFNENSKKKSLKGRFFSKKRAGIIGLLSLFGIGAGVLGGVLGPLSLPISLMENMTSGNDSSSTAMERRFLKVLGFSTQESDPVCANSSKIIKCRMGSISNKALSQLEKKGVVAVFDNDATNTGKKTGYPSKNPSSYTVDLGDGKPPVPVSAKDLPNFLAENPKAASKILGTKGAFNLRVKAWSGKHINKNLYSVFGVKKNGGIADGKGMTGASANEKYNESLAKLREKIPGLEKLNSVASGVEGKVKSHLDKSKKGGVGYTLAVAGCIVVKAPAYIAAGVVGVQLAQLLPVVNDLVLSPGSKMKASGVDVANSITASDGEAIGSLLTNQTPRASDGKMTSALDSEYLQASIGVNKNKPAASANFSPGLAILASPVLAAANKVENASAPACNAIMSPAAMYTALAVDSAATIAASATIIGGVIKVAASLAITTIATEVVKNIAGDAATAAITEFAQNDKVAKAEGEELGDVLGISSAAFFASGGMTRHLPTLKTSQLSDYAAIQAENEAFHKDMDIASLSPFDITSRHTFFGNIVYSMNMTAIANGTYNNGFLSSFANVVRMPFANASQNTNAATNFTKEYCNYAADFGLDTEDEANTPAINMAGMPCTGISSEQAAMSTEEAVSLIQSEGWIDTSKEVPDGATIDELVGTVIKEGTPLADFIETCGSPVSGDFIFNSAGCTVPTSSKSTSGVASSELDSSGCFVDGAGARVCTSTEDFGNTTTEGVKDARSLQAMSVFLLDFQIIQSINGEDEETDGPSVPPPVDADAVPTGTAQELAQVILSSGKVTDRTGQLQQIVNGTRTNVKTGVLQTLAALSTSNTFVISSMKRDQALGVGAGNASLHLQGMAADISGSAGLNGTAFGYNGHNPTVQAFLDNAAAIMPGGCQIGVPNQAYVNATKPKVKPGCVVFVDIGTAPHIHLGVRGGD